MALQYVSQLKNVMMVGIIFNKSVNYYFQQNILQKLLIFNLTNRVIKLTAGLPHNFE